MTGRDPSQHSGDLALRPALMPFGRRAKVREELSLLGRRYGRDTDEANPNAARRGLGPNAGEEAPGGRGHPEREGGASPPDRRMPSV